MDAAAVLGLILLKHVSDAVDIRRQELQSKVCWEFLQNYNKALLVGATGLIRTAMANRKPENMPRWQLDRD